MENLKLIYFFPTQSQWYFHFINQTQFFLQENLQINPMDPPSCRKEESKFKDKLHLILIPLHKYLESQPIQIQMEMTNSVFSF